MTRVFPSRTDALQIAVGVAAALEAYQRHPPAVEQATDIAHALADVFEQTNPQVDRASFLKACGLPLVRSSPSPQPASTDR